MNYRHLGSAIVMGSALLLGACGGGSSGTTTPISSALSGAWKGTYDDGVFHVMDVTVDGSAITAIAIDGTDTGESGALTELQANIYEYAMLGGGYGGFLTDSAANHSALLDMYTPAFGVLEKGATSVPTYTGSEIVGTWSGYSVHLDAAGNIDLVDASNVTVTFDSVLVAWNFSGTGLNGSFTGTLVDYDPNAGVWIGNYTSGGVSGTVQVYLSPDQTFAASWACDNGTPLPSVDCSYNSWNKQ